MNLTRKRRALPMSTSFKTHDAEEILEHNPDGPASGFDASLGGATKNKPGVDSPGAGKNLFKKAGANARKGENSSATALASRTDVDGDADDSSGRLSLSTGSAVGDAAEKAKGSAKGAAKGADKAAHGDLKGAAKGGDDKGKGGDVAGAKEKATGLEEDKKVCEWNELSYLQGGLIIAGMLGIATFVVAGTSFIFRHGHDGYNHYLEHQRQAAIDQATGRAINTGVNQVQQGVNRVAGGGGSPGVGVQRLS